MNPKLVRRTAFLGLLLPCLYFGTASAMFIFRIHRENSAPTGLHLLTAPPPSASQRIVVFAPHCDDETLGAGGLIEQAVRAGANVRVVMLTNGDGFRVAVERQYRNLNVGPNDFIRFAALRQEESCRALNVLGLIRSDVAFLGYPDRGLMSLWTVNWSPDHPFTSSYTGVDRSPYARTFHAGAPYCGQSLLNDISSILREYKPTDVYVTHPSDDHPDHAAASAFVSLALHQLRCEEPEWANDCRLHYYLVHRGDWPTPQGLQEDEPLSPPGEMAALDTRWMSRPLSSDDERRKAKAILAYRSQTALMKRFLVSFARRSELFGDLPDARVPRIEDGKMKVDGRVDEWRTLSPVALDPIGDNLLRDFQAGGDVKAVYACRDSRNLYLRVDTAQRLSRRVQFRLGVRYLGDAITGESGGSFRATVSANGAVVPGDLRGAEAENRLELAIPLRELGYAHSLAVNVETAFAGIQVDRTGYRFLDL